MKQSLRSRLTVVISVFVVLTLSFFATLMLVNTRLQFNALSDVIVNYESDHIDSGSVVMQNNDNIDFFVIESISGAQVTAKNIIIATAIVFIIISIIIAYYISGKALKPIEQFKHELQIRDMHTIDNPFDAQKKVPQEIISLQNSFEIMSKRVVEAFNQQKRFTDNAAHELKTPLATMKAGIQLLQMEGKDLSKEDFDDSLQRIMRQLERFNTTIEDLEMLSSQERCDLIKEPIEISKMVSDIVKSNKNITAEKELEVVTIGENLKIFGQRNLLIHALDNVLQNAVKYSDYGGKIYVAWTIVDDCCSILIENTGENIPKASQDFIFQPFFRVDDSRSRMTGGAGLGLSIVSDIVSKHDGEVKLITSKDNQTVFQIKLPIVQ